MAIQVSLIISVFVLIRHIFILVNESNERRASFQLGGNDDDDLSNESPPRTSPTSKQIGEGESLKRVN